MSTSKDKEAWQAIIADAEAEIEKLKVRQAQLRASIRFFRIKMEAGDPIPEGLERMSSADGSVALNVNTLSTHN
jgi:hypothetical protein